MISNGYVTGLNYLSVLPVYKEIGYNNNIIDRYDRQVSRC